MKAAALGRAGASLALAAVLLWTTGCASLTGAPDQASADSPLAAGAPAGAAFGDEIEAPAPLKALLLQHLDLSRLARLRDDEAPAEIEMRRLLAAAPAQARELLQTEGYFEPEISVQPQPGTPLRVGLRVRPGPRIRVAQIDRRTEGELARRLAGGDATARATDQRLRQAGPLQVGDTFRNPAWSDTKLQWLATLRAAGYAAAELRSSLADIDVAAGSASLEAVLDSGALFLAGPLRVEGLNHHDLATVQHLAGFGPGQPLTEMLLLDFQDRLQKAGLFDTVSVGFDVQPDSSQAATVVVRLNELPLQQVTLGAGISNDNGPRATLEHTHRRAFGWALSAGNKLEWGRDLQRWGGDFLTHPGPGFTRWLLGVQIERQRSDTDVVLSQRLRLGRTQDTPTIERLAFVEMLRSRQSVSAGTSVDAQALSANLHLVLRRLDSVLLPTRGLGLSLQLGAGQAHSTQGDSGPFARVLGRPTAYLPIDVAGGPWYAKARVEAGQVLKRDSVVVPDALGFRAGGDESVRGYAYRSLAPQVNANVNRTAAITRVISIAASHNVVSMPQKSRKIWIHPILFSHGFHELSRIFFFHLSFFILSPHSNSPGRSHTQSVSSSACQR